MMQVNSAENRSIILDKDVEVILKATYINAQRVCQRGVDKCEKHFSALLQALTTPPSYSTLRVNSNAGSTTDTQLAVEEILKQDYKKKGWPPPLVELHPLIPDILLIPNRGPIKGLARLQREVVVDIFCGMAVLRGANVFAQGIMGCPPGMARGDPVSVYADLDGRCLKGFTKPYHGEKIFVGNGVARVSRDQLFCQEGTKLRGVGVEMTEPLYQAPCLADILPERVFPQNLPSVLCGHVLDPKPGELVLDMCASPGGKTTHIACLMKNQGRVVALDKSPQKVEKVERRCKDWSLSCVETYSWDASKAFSTDSDMSGGPPYPGRMFDRVLLDAPCSALGQRPSFINKMTERDLNSYPKYQRKILSAAVELVKPGGVLVYSTCSLPVEENEGQVEWVLENYPDFKLDKQVPHIGKPGLEGTSLTNEQLQMLQRFDPTDCLLRDPNSDTDTIGFFIAKFKRVGDLLKK